jgi:hypothetical protein
VRADQGASAEFKHAIRLFIQHSDREEEDVLKKLASQLTPEENDKIARDFVRPFSPLFLFAA